MKDLLYLKDEQIKDFIQLLFYAYRETFADPKEILSKKCVSKSQNPTINASFQGLELLPQILNKLDRN